MNGEKTNIGALFNRIAPTYDTLNHLLSLGIDKRWRRMTAKSLPPSERVLDVAVGTADLSIELLKQRKAAHVTGIDLSQEMMRIGKSKAQQLELPIDFLEASALDMPFDNDSFPTVVCAFGVRNFSNLEEGLSEMFRVLQPGGTMAVLEFSYPSNCFVRVCYDFYFSHILPVVGRLMSGDATAYRYLNRSVKEFVWGEAFCEKVKAIGFSSVEYRPLTLGICTLYLAQKARTP